MGIAIIRGGVAKYAWGGKGALSQLLGWPDTDRVEAEWWLGTHPLRPSTISSGEALSGWLEAHGGAGELPFLLKVLSPATPLSLQVHPTAEQAAEGFRREEESGLAIDAPTRIFKDPHPKPELVVALGGTFHALAGIRPVEDTIAHLEQLVGDADFPAVSGWMNKLSSWPTAEVIGWLLGAGEEATSLLTELGVLADKDDTLSRLYRHYPGDPGVAVGLMMHRLTLLPGEAAFLNAGQLHAYLEGNAIELMAPSDNVLRGGLTPKHVDIDALLEVALVEPVDPPLLEPELAATGGVRYAPAGQPFALGLLEGTEVSASDPLSSAVVVVVTDGEWSVAGATESLTLRAGEAAVVSPDEGELRLAGTGQVWWARAS